MTLWYKTLSSAADGVALSSWKWTSFQSENFKEFCVRRLNKLHQNFILCPENISWQKRSCHVSSIVFIKQFDYTADLPLKELKCLRGNAATSFMEVFVNQIINLVLNISLNILNIYYVCLHDTAVPRTFRRTVEASSQPFVFPGSTRSCLKTEIIALLI